MHDDEKTREQLINELIELRQKVATLEAAEAEHKRSDHSQQQEHTLIKAALDTQPDTFLVYEAATGKAVLWNKALCQLSGYSDREIASMKASDRYFQHSDVPKVKLGIQKLISQGVVSAELSLLTKDGRTIPTEYSASMLLDDEANPKYIIAIGRDVTQRKKIGKALRESEKRFRALFEAMSEGLALHEILYDENGVPVDYVILDANPAYFTHTGINRESAVGKKASDLYGSGSPPYFEIYQRVASTGRPERFETYFSPMDKHFSISIFSPGKNQFATVFEDITERKRSEETLRENEARFGSIIENTEAGYFFIDKDGIIQDVNSSWVRLYKYESIDDVLGQHFTVIQKVDDVEQAKEVVDGIMCGDSRYLHGEFSRKCRDDSIGYHSFSARPVMIAGEVVGIEGFIIDTTKRRLVEEELRKYREHLEEMVKTRTAELEAANKELKSFAYIVSHDLKAPLRGISHLAQWLVEDYVDTFDEIAKEMSDLLIGRVKRMDQLIDGILDYSRIGRITDRAEQIETHQLIEGIIDALAPPEHINIVIQGHLPILTGERIRLTQLFQNLLSNAVYFLDKPEGEIAIECADNSDAWTFSIKDNGPGIDKRYHERIFQIFQPLAPRDERESTGIGLAVVKKIVELYGGDIWLESELGKGSTFFFTLPKTTTS